MEAGSKGISRYITRSNNTFMQYIVTQPIMNLCGRSYQRPGLGMSRWWWEQAGLDLKGAKKRTAETDLDGEELIGEGEGIPLESQQAGIEGGGRK